MPWGWRAHDILEVVRIHPSTPDHAQRAPADDGRRRHYADFYEPHDSLSDDSGLTGVVFGNCQAESLRQFLPSSVNWVRMPPVHELVATDLPHVERLLERADVLISQPVRDDYHGMPLGTSQLFSRVRELCARLVFPVIRFAGLYPTHAIVRPPSDPSLVPPLVAYHDLRTLAEAAGIPLPALTVQAIRAVAALSTGDLRSREERFDAIPISDVFDAPSFAQMRTINHPGNPVWTTLAERVITRLDLAAVPADPGRPVLDSVHAPRNPAVIDAWSLDAQPTDHWVVSGQPLADEERHRVHLDWYREHPDVVEAGVRRHEPALRLLAAS